MLSELRASTNGEPVTLVTDVNTAAAPLGVHCWCKSANQHQRSPCAVQQKRAPNRLDTASREASARRRRSPSPTSTWAILLCSSSDLRPTKRMKSVSAIRDVCVRRPWADGLGRRASRGGGAARRTSSPSRFYLKPLCHLGCVLVKHAPQNAQSTNATERPGCVTTRVQGPPSAKTAAQ